MSIQELLPTTAIAEAGKSEAGAGNTHAVSGGVFAEILQEFSAGHLLESELDTGESVPPGDVEEDVPLKELRLVPSSEVGVPEDSEDEDGPIATVSTESGRAKEHLHDLPLFQAPAPEHTVSGEVTRVAKHLGHVFDRGAKSAEEVGPFPPERTVSGEVARVAKLLGRVFNGSTKSVEEVGPSPSGVPASTQAVERVNEVVHAPGARAHNPLIRATADPTDLPETVTPKTVAPEIGAATPKVHVNGETVAQETVSETREPVRKIVAEAVRERPPVVRERPLLSKNEEAVRLETPPRIRQETVNLRPVPGPALVSVEEVVRDATGHAATAVAARGTPKRIGSPALSGIPIAELEPVSESFGSATLRVPPGIVDKLVVPTEETGDGGKTVRLAIASKTAQSHETTQSSVESETAQSAKAVRLAAESITAQPTKAAYLTAGSRSDASVEAKYADTLPQAASGSPANVTVPLGALPTGPVVEHAALRAAEQPTLHPPIRSTVSELGGAAIKGVRYLVSGGHESITVRLVPESLGEVHVS
ncbi:MAG: hypothetical protein IID08_09570, partial [Candidatus Hydrogenedentes bacterium]|nr:hypothetical protein [Candidatus Hydrogenedentota bacterium]